MKFIQICLIVFFSMFLSAPDTARALQCRGLFTPGISSAFLPNKPVRFMSLNTLNLYLHQGRFNWNEDGSLDRVNQDHLPRQKPEWQTKALADVILETQPDFIMLQEIEGWDSLDRFNRRYLDSSYRAYLPPTNDGRGIGIAFLVREGMGIKVKRESFDHLIWTNTNGVQENVFARNLPLFKVYIENHDTPKLIVAGVHYKSRMDRSSDPKSFKKRKREAEESVRILKTVQEEYPLTPLIVMGDFNSNKDQEELASFKELDVFDLLDKPEVFEDEHGMGDSTFIFFPRGEDVIKARSVDGALLSSSLRSQLLSSSVYRYKDPVTGLVIPLPKNIDERNRKPSDHYPVLFDLAPKFLYGGYNHGD